jgi:hypothetical protein
VTWQNVSQYGNAGYKGPAPMVLGNMGDALVCYYCNKPGHLCKDCYKLRNNLEAGCGACGSSRGRRGGRNGGRNHGGRSSLNTIAKGTMDVQEIMRLDMAAAANKEP